MSPEDLQLRNRTYRLFVALGRAPAADEIAAATRRTPEEVREALQRLHHAHALVLHQEGSEIRMANPFSAVPTAYRVQSGGRWWYANCAWDAFGICAALHSDGLPPSGGHHARRPAQRTGTRLVGRPVVS